MNARPVVGIPTRTQEALEQDGDLLPDSWALPQRYVHALVPAGATPFLLPLLTDDPAALRDAYVRLDGLFLAGGTDVAPARYNQAVDPHAGSPDEARDLVEHQLVRWAVEDGLPIFGACRGLQLINVALGGSLHQDIRALRPGSIKHDYFPEDGHARDYLAHEVQIVAGSRLRQIYGAERIAVNSMHHQGAHELGRDLFAVAHAPDGLLEAVEMPGPGYCVGVQWHPETLLIRDRRTRGLMRSFVEAAAEYRSRTDPHAARERFEPAARLAG
jgi:putative glutamine amidotransferase